MSPLNDKMQNSLHFSSVRCRQKTSADELSINVESFSHCFQRFKIQQLLDSGTLWISFAMKTSARRETQLPATIVRMIMENLFEDGRTSPCLSFSSGNFSSENVQHRPRLDHSKHGQEKRGSEGALRK